MKKIPVNRNVLLALLPKTHLVASPAIMLVKKTFTLNDIIPPESKDIDVDLTDSDMPNARSARFRYVDETGKPFIITIGALMYTNVTKGAKTQNVLDIMLAFGKDELLIPSEFTVLSAEDKLWDNGKPKYPSYMYSRFIAERKSKSFEQLITDFDFVASLQDDVLADKYKSRECLKDVVFSNIVFD